MDLRRLKYFMAVYEERNIGRAAVRLNMSQPPLTRHIRQLEAETGATLFLRSIRGVEATEAAHVLYGEARQIDALVERAAAQTRLAAEGRLGRLDIGVFGSNMLGIADFLARFRLRNPAVEIVLHSLNRNEQIEALRQRRIDLGFTLLSARQSDLVSRGVGHEALIVAVNARDPLAKRDRLTLREIAERPIIVYGSGPRPNLIDLAHELFQKEGLQPQFAHQAADSLIPAIVLVAAGYGVSLVPNWATQLSVRGVRFCRLRVRRTEGLDLHVHYRKDDTSPLLASFLQSMQKSR